MKRLTFLLAAVLGACFTTTVHAAQTCALRQLADLKLTEAADGSLTVPVTLGGNSQHLTIDLSTPLSSLDASYSDAAGLTTRQMPAGMIVQDAKSQARGIITVPSFAIGNAGGTDIQFLRMEPGRGIAGSVGLLGMDILSSFDIEVDFAQDELKLYQHEECNGHVVYWADAYAMVDYQTDLSKHPMFKMQLDGHDILVALTADPGKALMGLTAAKRLFGIDEKNPSLKEIKNSVADGPKVYRYPFKTLSVEGVSVLNPDIVIYADSSADECKPDFSHGPTTQLKFCYGGADLKLALGELKHLHMYLATKDKKLFVTAADASRGEPKNIAPSVQDHRQ